MKAYFAMLFVLPCIVASAASEASEIAMTAAPQNVETTTNAVADA